MVRGGSLSGLPPQPESGDEMGNFLARMFAEKDGTPSASRAISFIGSVVWFAILFLRFQRTGQMPTPGELLAGGFGANAAYVANQAKRILEPFGQKGGK